MRFTLRECVRLDRNVFWNHFLSRFITSRIFIMLFLGGAVPIVGGIALENILPGWRWDHHPFHAVVEGVGAAIALMIASLIIFMRATGKLHSAYIWFASGLIGMGVLDGFHAVLGPGEAFVWTHSLATFVGGTFFALIWLPQRVSQGRFAN